ncbi:MAG: hypothetical protein J7604_24870 [Sporocytophaga sp.]|uniref:hypothetical protein n=1 Tax=Sporocytophaga sp. TaxID=2231183 RepID=UPI001B276613|nr:hypothetical protein [Sporocytophaga sp.]MBO9703464.1 hypothetical protein [Sporocytophaga sp.]
MEEENGLAIEKLRKYKGLENLSDKEAYEIISVLKKFSYITYKYYPKIKQQENKDKNEISK